MSDNERGFKRPGRPSVGNTSYSGKCDVRLTAAENSMLDTLAERNGVSRSAIVRKAIRDFYIFNTDEEVYDE